MTQGVFALVVDAKDEKAAAFYQRHGFLTFGSLARQLILPFAENSPHRMRRG